MFRSTHFWRIWISLGMLWTSMMKPFMIWTWAYNFKSFHVVWTTQGLSCGDTKACKWVMKDSNVYAHLRSIQGPRSLLWSWHPDPENVETRVSSSCCDILTLILPRGWCSNSQMQLWLPKAQRRAQILPPRSDWGCISVDLLVQDWSAKDIALILSMRPHVRQRETPSESKKEESRIISDPWLQKFRFEQKCQVEKSSQVNQLNAAQKKTKKTFRPGLHELNLQLFAGSAQHWFTPYNIYQ